MDLKELYQKNFPIKDFNQLKLSFINDPKYNKYFNFDHYIFEAINEINMMNMNNINNNQKNVLDISCGVGYFAWFCRELGYNILTTDCPNINYEVIRKILKIISIIHIFYRNKYDKLPFNDNQFDYIKATKILPMSYWNDLIWKDFLFDCYRILKPTGVLFVHPNRNSQQGYTSLCKAVKDEQIKEKFQINKKDLFHLLTKL